MDRARAFLDRLARWLRRHPVAAVVAAGVLLALLVLVPSAWWTCGFQGCPDVSALAAYQPEGTSLLLDRHGEPFAELAPLPGEVVPLHELPSRVPQAFVAVEDRRFYEHGGVDWLRLGGALLANLRAGGFREGASTITMQLARNLFSERIQPGERTVERKVLEMRVARAIEERFSKQEILELYLNHIYFGHGARGIEAASRHYFGRPAAELTLPQAALLAALPKAPAHYDPREDPEAARERRDLVLELMAEQGRVPPRQAAEAAEAPLGVVAQPPPRRRSGPGAAPYFAEAVRRVLDERFGSALQAEPVRVWTTLDLRAQRAAEAALAARLRAAERGALGALSGREAGPLQGAVVLLDARAGDVLAWVGGRDFATSGFDRVSHARRQPGSAFKPFVLAAALLAGHPLSALLEDRPFTLELAGGRTWSPRNFGDDYDRRVTVRNALVHSKNVATVRLAQQVGTDRVAETARRLGIEPPIPEEPSMALGTVDVSPLELAAAYTPFATLGDRTEPRLVLRVERPDGTLLWENGPRSEPVLDPAVAYLVNHVLADAVRRGTGRGALRAGVEGVVAGKTGTSDDNTDAWFVGYTPRRVGVVWFGYDHPRSMGRWATGGRLAAPVWGRVMAAVEEEPTLWTRPEGVVDRPVDRATGFPLERGCAPRRGPPRRELFLAGAVPEARCPGGEGRAEAVIAQQREEEARRKEAARREREERRQAAEAAERAQARDQERARERREEASEARPGPPNPRQDPPESADRPEPAEREAPGRSLGGWWELQTRIGDSAVDRYEGLTLGFRVHLRQEGGRLTGRGEKWAEAGEALPAGRRTPIELEGSIDGRDVRLRFFERGARRASSGTLHLRLTPDRSTMTGRFESGAASSRGTARMLRIP